MAQRRQQQVTTPPMQEMYPLSFPEVTEPDDNGVRLLMFRIPAPNKVIMFPLTDEVWKAIGQELTAPSVEVAAPADIVREAARQGIVLPDGSTHAG